LYSLSSILNLFDMSNNSKQRDVEAMPPPPSREGRGRKPIVLEEDEWVAALEGIIERDFFPDLAELKRKLEMFGVRHYDCYAVNECEQANSGSVLLRTTMLRAENHISLFLACAGCCGGIPVIKLRLSNNIQYRNLKLGYDWGEDGFPRRSRGTGRT